jgi:hypothetical protein
MVEAFEAIVIPLAWATGCGVGDVSVQEVNLILEMDHVVVGRIVDATVHSVDQAMGPESGERVVVAVRVEIDIEPKAPKDPNGLVIARSGRGVQGARKRVGKKAACHSVQPFARGARKIIAIRDEICRVQAADLHHPRFPSVA